MSFTERNRETTFAVDESLLIVWVNNGCNSRRKLMARSEARRLLAKAELFKTLIFDFSHVDTIGPSFADEIYRVFPKACPHVKLITINANKHVQQMMTRAKNTRLPA